MKNRSNRLNSAQLEKHFAIALVLGIVIILACSGCQKADTLTVHGLKEYNNKHYDKAVDLFTRALSSQPSNPIALMGRGNAWAEMKQYTNALEDFNKLIDLDPSSFAAYFSRGLLRAEMGETTAAIEDYTTTVRLRPDHVAALINRADLLKKQGQIERAVEDYTTVLNMSPRDAKALRSRGYLRITLGRYSEAIDDYANSLVLEPANSSAFANRADAWYMLENYSNAISDYRVAIKLQPDLQAPLNNLAWILATCTNAAYRNGAEAVLLAQRVLQARSNEIDDARLADTYGTLAAAYAETGDYKSAVQFQLEAIRLSRESFGDVRELEKQMALYRQETPLRMRRGHGFSPLNGEGVK